MTRAHARRSLPALILVLAVLSGCGSNEPAEPTGKMTLFAPSVVRPTAPVEVSPPTAPLVAAKPVEPPTSAPSVDPKPSSAPVVVAKTTPPVKPVVVAPAAEPSKPAAPDPFLTRMEALRDKGKHRDALPQLEEWLKKHPDDVPGLVLRGLLLQELKRLPESEAVLTEAIRKDPKTVRGHERRFYTRIYGGNLDGALEDARTWARLAPTDPWAPMQSGCVLCKLGKVQESLVSFDAALTLDPRHRSSLEWRARARFVLNQFEPALADAQKALELKSSDPILHGIRGACLLELGRAKEAVPALSEAIRLAPNQAVWYRDRADAHAKVGNPELAARDRRRADELSPLPMPGGPVGGLAVERLTDAAHYDAYQKARDQAVRTNLQNAGRLGAMGLGR